MDEEDAYDLLEDSPAGSPQAWVPSVAGLGEDEDDDWAAGLEED